MWRNLLRSCCVAAFVPAIAWAQADALVRVTAEDCRRLVAHEPSADVTYKPGVDARGKPVAPADLGGGTQLNLGTDLSIPVTIDLAKRYGAGALPLGTEAKVSPGTVTVKNGKAFFNGQPMTDYDQHVIAEACRKKGLR